MQYKETNKQKFYMRNVYINQIMKPEIQNNLNYAYFENPSKPSDYFNNQIPDLNQENIFFNNDTFKSIYHNCFPNKKSSTNNIKKNYSKKNNNKKEYYFDNIFEEANEINKKEYLYRNKKNNEIGNQFNEKSFSENKMKKFKPKCDLFKKVVKKKIKEQYNNVENIKYNNIKKEVDNERNSLIEKYNYTESRKQNKNTLSYASKKEKKFINENKKNINVNNCITSPNVNNYIGKFKSKFNKNENINLYKNNNLTIKNQNKSMDKYFSKNKIHHCKSVVTNKKKRCIYQNYINNYNYNEALKRYNEGKYMNNSPSYQSYSSFNDENFNNSNNFIWLKKSKENNKRNYNIDNNNNLFYYRKPYIKKEDILSQNLIKLANSLTNVNSYLCNTEVYYPNAVNEQLKALELKEIFEQSAILIQSFFRGFSLRKKFDSFYYNYKYNCYCKGFEILELIINYFFKKRINILEEKHKFLNYLTSLLKLGDSNYEMTNNNATEQKHKSLKSFKVSNYFYNNYHNDNDDEEKIYDDLVFPNEIADTFNIIRMNKKNKAKEIEKRYKEKINIITIKMNRLTKENYKLKELNKKNEMMETKFREISKENKKKNDIIDIITNDNKSLAKKLKIIQEKIKQFEIQNQDYFNYNHEEELYDKNQSINFFEEYRNLFLLFLLHKLHERNYLSVLRKYFFRFKKNIFDLISIEKKNCLLKEQKLLNIISNTNHKNQFFFYNKFLKFHYKSLLHQKEAENKHNILKYKLLNLVKSKEKLLKSNLKIYFQKFYYKGIIANKNADKNKLIIENKKQNCEKIIKLLVIINNQKDKQIQQLKKEYFIKWHLYTKILALKTIINDKRRKKKQKQKLKKKNENDIDNKLLPNNDILHLGKSDIYILNKEKDNDLLISLDDKNENIEIDNKITNVIQATNKLAQIFQKASMNYKQP